LGPLAAMRSPQVAAVAAALLALLGPRAVLAGSRGLFLIGGSGEPEEPPVIYFGDDDATATVVTAMDGSLKVRRDGVTHVSLNENEAELPVTEIAGNVIVGAMSMGGMPQWHLYHLDTFDNSETGVWSKDGRSVCAAPNDLFLGGHCKLAGTSTSREYTDLPPHTHVRVSARVHYFDEWKGEDIAMFVDKAGVWSQSHEWCPGFLTWKCLKFGVDSCGRDIPDRLSVRVEATIPHSASTLDLAFESTLAPTTDPCQVSWGVDDVALELMDRPRPSFSGSPPCPSCPGCPRCPAAEMNEQPRASYAMGDYAPAPSAFSAPPPDGSPELE